MSDEPLTFLASIAPTEGGLKAHGLEGFRMVLDIPDEEMLAYARLLICRKHVLKVTVEVVGERELRTRRRKPKPVEPEWGDDDDEANTDDDTG